LENALRGAVERNELLVMYQPQVELATGRLAGVEALVRWQHPELGLVPPVRFIGLAENIGIIHDIGAWVLRAACEQMTAWDAQGLRVPQVAVNLSVKQLERTDFVDQVETVLRDCALAPNRLELEVTESMLMRSPDAAKAVLTALKALGTTLALDDFGTGYSSLAMLRLLPLDRLKIDQSFVRDIGSDDDDEAIVRAIIALATSLGLETVAEGVEGLAQFNFLREASVEIAQGYYFGRPMTAEDLAETAKRLTVMEQCPLER
jgi:EAL domain-containing protein (putative c-di-GMP-specific phosphodiesterase class I)